MRKKAPKTPTNLEECLAELIANTSKEDLQKFQDMEENAAGASVHFWGGMRMRNSWGLWDPQSPLTQWFFSIGIWHADDMSGMIFDSLHRKLNGKSLDIRGQVKFYQDYWKKTCGVDPEGQVEKAKRGKL